jgi:HD-like signal output (HDOD) protein
MKHRILFVDDEPMVLQGLQRMLRPMREEWDMVFVDGGEKALATLGEGAFDVVVTDMRMPGMNGAQLLHEVMSRYPTVVRLVLSGFADKELVAQCLGVAHQYISKPCDAEQLKAMIRNACVLGGGHVTQAVRKILGTIDRLPSLPQAYVQLEKALAREGAGSEELGNIIRQDMGMTAKILKIVNSSFFGLRRTIATPQEAVAYLGTETIKVLVLGNAIFELAQPLATRHLTLDDLWEHTLTVARGARAIAQLEGASPEVCEQTFVGGILSDVGILVLAANVPEAYDRAASIVLEEKVLLTTAELEEFGITHAEVGAYLLGLWGIPAPVLKLVGMHHRPHLIREAGFLPELAVYAADVLAGEAGGNPLFRTGWFDEVALARLGYLERVGPWREAFSSP